MKISIEAIRCWRNILCIIYLILISAFFIDYYNITTIPYAEAMFDISFIVLVPLVPMTMFTLYIDIKDTVKGEIENE